MLCEALMYEEINFKSNQQQRQQGCNRQYQKDGVKEHSTKMLSVNGVLILPLKASEIKFFTILHVHNRLHSEIYEQTGRSIYKKKLIRRSAILLQ